MTHGSLKKNQTNIIKIIQNCQIHNFITTATLTKTTAKTKACERTTAKFCQITYFPQKNKQLLVRVN